MATRILTLCSSIALIFSASWAQAQDAAESLSELLARSPSIAGEFVQLLLDEEQQLLQESSGDFLIKQPGFFRWQTLEPFPQLLVSNLETVWLYDPDLEQVTIRPFDNTEGQSPAVLLSGDAELIERYYRVTQTQPDQFELLPKVNEGSFERIDMQFSDQAISKLAILDTLGQTTEFRFSKINAQSAVDNALFEFTVPEGVDVLIDE